MTQGYPDRFEVVNGPEDGAVFSLTRSPFDVGSDPGCAVHLQFDQTVRPIHARATVVSDGYRIRRLKGWPVFVNGKRAGAVRSRVVRHGDIVQVGGTQLCLQCAPGGLAGRSHGMVHESDLGWALRLCFASVTGALGKMARLLRRMLGKTFVLALVVAGVLVLVGFFRPWWVSNAIGMAVYWFRLGWYHITHWASGLLG